MAVNSFGVGQYPSEVPQNTHSATLPISTYECVDIFQDVVSSYLERSRVMGEHKEVSRYNEILSFIVEVVSAVDRQSLGTEADVTRIWAENFASGSLTSNVLRRSFIFDITSEFRLRLGSANYKHFVKELCEAYSMVDYKRYQDDKSMSVITGLNATSMSFVEEGLLDNPWFVSFLLLSTVKLSSVPAKKEV